MIIHLLCKKIHSQEISTHCSVLWRTVGPYNDNQSSLSDTLQSTHMYDRTQRNIAHLAKFEEVELQVR